MDRNSIIKKSHIKALEKFNQELIAFANYTQNYPPTLYEDMFTSFTLWNVYVKDGYLCYEYDGKMEKTTSLCMTRKCILKMNTTPVLWKP